ncbi:MAG: iron-siderophore ABC transporter substrate-binding protein [Kurthia sp.]
MKKWMTVCLGIILLIFAAGCTEKEDAKPEEAKEPTNQETITVVDGFGEQKFEGVQERVIALEWSIAEELLAVGVQPVGMADIENFNKWVTIDEKVADSVVDVGGRVEPNIEEIAKLKPDVIIGTKGRHEPIKAQLEKIAPVIMYDSSTPEAEKNQLAFTLGNLKQTAKLVGKEAEAQVAIDRMQESVKEAKARIEKIDLPTNQFVFTQAYTVNQAPTFRLFATNSIVSQVLEQMGLENKIQETAPGSGIIETSVEGIAPYADAMFLHTVQKDDPLFDLLKTHAGWNEFQFVKEKQLYDIGAGIWTFGSVLSIETLIKQTEEALMNGNDEK